MSKVLDSLHCEKTLGGMGRKLIILIMKENICLIYLACSIFSIVLMIVEVRSKPGRVWSIGLERRSWGSAWRNGIIGEPYCSLQLPENIGTSKVEIGLFSHVTSNRRENGLHWFRLAVRTEIFSGGVGMH